MAFKVKNKKKSYVVFDKKLGRPIAEFNKKQMASNFFSLHQDRGDKNIILVENK